MNITKESLKTKTDEELADLQKVYSSLRSEHVLIEQEWQRRSRLEQYELNRKIISQQHELNSKIFDQQNKLIILSALMGIIGVIIGNLLP